jgi:cobalt-zinc-cadmium resistance protein CzcA
LQQQRYLAETTYDLSGLQLEMEVRTAWSKAFRAKRKWALYTELDTLYARFLKSATLNFEEEAISRLEYVTAKNQALQIGLEKQQAHSDYLMALQRLNLWLDPDIFYTVPEELPKMAPPVVDPPLAEHPAFLLSQHRIQEADAKYKVARTGLLPKLSVQGGMQQLNGQDGFYSYQAGISFPLLSGTQRGKVKAAELDREIARAQALLEQRRLGLDYQQALETFLKWENTWQFYRDQALPLSGEQRKGALFAYREGALDHTAFSQIMRDAIETEMDALDALENYLSSLFHLTYFKKENYDN